MSDSSLDNSPIEPSTDFRITSPHQYAIGTMKTYWLQAKECRAPVPRIANSVPPTQEIERKPEPKQSTAHPNPPKETGRAVVYSPITFQDVARRSIVNSPEKSNSRDYRSNSAGAVYPLYDPADYFGSMVLEGEETYGMCPISMPFQFRNRSTTAPPRTNCKQEVSLVSQDKPLKTAPSILLNNSIDNHVNHTSREEEPHTTIKSVTINSHNDVAVEQPKKAYEFGKSMYQYAKKLENKFEKNHKEVANSKSDGNLCNRKVEANSLSNSQSQQFPRQHRQHDQCCSSFGTSHRSRYQSNACSIV